MWLKIAFGLDTAVYEIIKESLEQNAELFIRQYTNITGMYNFNTEIENIEVKTLSYTHIPDNNNDSVRVNKTHVYVIYQQEPKDEVYIFEETIQGPMISIAIPNGSFCVELDNYFDAKRIRSEDYNFFKIFLPKV